MRAFFSFVFCFVLSEHSFAQTDTLFYNKVDVDGVLHTIYREPDPMSTRYDDLAYFDIEFMDRDVYEMEVSLLQESGVKPSSHPIEDLPKHWVGLFRYNDEWVAYYPCNFLWQYKVIINDTEYIDWTGEGPLVNYLYDSKRLDTNTWEFKMKGNYREDDTIRIHLIDAEKGIAIFEEDGRMGNIFYPMITGTTIHQVPLIVNNCPSELQDEFDFGTIDFSVFIK